MKRFLFLVLISSSLFANDMIIKKSGCDMDGTLENIKKIIRLKGLELFGVIDHAEGAKKAGMTLDDSKVVIFGNPKMGTVLMQEDITIGLDLPLRILVYKDKNGVVKMAYRDGKWLALEHSIKAEKLLLNMNSALENITEKAGQCKKD
jgi:uncharacterized protein (DUF302 family)